MLPFLRRLTGDRRSADANRLLGLSLAFVAGAMNAGGFLAVDQYTSHMTGIVSSLADAVALYDTAIALTALGSIAAFVAGAAYSAILINWGRHHRTHSRYAYPLLWEAGLLLVFGLMGGTLELKSGFVPLTVILLCFIMGLQNAIITKISNAEIRTTHMTGIVTDIGIELGKLLYWNRHGEQFGRVQVDRQRLQVLSLLALYFFMGGIAGAFGFNRLGYVSTLPLALLLISLALVPMLDDLRSGWRRFRRARQI